MPWRAADGVFAENIEGETILLDSAGNQYLTLNETASTIWELATQDYSVDAIASELESRWEISREDAHTAAQKFIERLLDAGLLIEA